MSQYFLVAGSSAEDSKDALFTVLKSRIEKSRLADSIHLLEVPENLKFGSFDSLIKQADELAKQDTLVEATVRRIERHLCELEPSADFRVFSSRSEVPVEEYLPQFRWDDAKFPRARPLSDILSVLTSSLGKLDEEVKSRMQSLQDLRQQLAVLARKETASLVQRDLTEVLTPEIVTPDDFVYSEHLTTLVVVVPRGGEPEWLSIYETLGQNDEAPPVPVVPMSSAKVGSEDKEGNQLYRVVLFKSGIEAFKSAARQHRFLVRDFQYDPTRLSELLAARAALSTEVKKQESLARKICQAAYSDAFVGFMHLKAIRVFVESVLRFGLPPRFACFLIKTNGKLPKLRSELAEVLSTNSFGKSFTTTSQKSQEEEEGGEYYSYVSFGMIINSSPKVIAGNR